MNLSGKLGVSQQTSILFSTQCLVRKCLLLNQFYKLPDGYRLQVWTKHEASENSEDIISPEHCYSGTCKIKHKSGCETVNRMAELVQCTHTHYTLHSTQYAAVNQDIGMSEWVRSQGLPLHIPTHSDIPTLGRKGCGMCMKEGDTLLLN